ncbi:MAG: hypothetical protein FJ130_12750 [Deltaproteobacteria bacterium]|nr:hypothetical protein [Deltaproteobacteria bacterium]
MPLFIINILVLCKVGDGGKEIGRWGDGEMGRWGDRENLEFQTTRYFLTISSFCQISSIRPWR